VGSVTPGHYPPTPCQTARSSAIRVAAALRLIAGARLIAAGQKATGLLPDSVAAKVSDQAALDRLAPDWQ
jgi:hypothetical protein